MVVRRLKRWVMVILIANAYGIDRHLRLGIHTDKEHFKEYAQNNDSQRYRDGVEGELDWTRKAEKRGLPFMTADVALPKMIGLVGNIPTIDTTTSNIAIRQRF